MGASPVLEIPQESPILVLFCFGQFPCALCPDAHHLSLPSQTSLWAAPWDLLMPLLVQLKCIPT